MKNNQFIQLPSQQSDTTQNPQNQHQESLVFQKIDLPLFQKSQNTSSSQRSGQQRTNMSSSDTDGQNRFQPFDDDLEQGEDFSNYLQRQKQRLDSKLYSKFKKLQNIECSRLCRYVKMIPYAPRQNSYLIVSQSHADNLAEFLNYRQYRQNNFTEQELVRISYSVLKSLEVLKTRAQIEMVTLNPKQIVFDSSGQIKLAEFANFFLIGDVPKNELFQSDQLFYLCPEFFLLKDEWKTLNFKGEIWSLGIILRQCIDQNYDFLYNQFLNNKQLFVRSLIGLYPKYQECSIFQSFPYITDSVNPLEQWLEGNEGISDAYSYEFRDFLSQCLEINPSRRHTVNQLLSHHLFTVQYKNICEEASMIDNLRIKGELAYNSKDHRFKQLAIKLELFPSNVQISDIIEIIDSFDFLDLIESELADLITAYQTSLDALEDSSILKVWKNQDDITSSPLVSSQTKEKVSSGEIKLSNILTFQIGYYYKIILDDLQYYFQTFPSKDQKQFSKLLKFLFESDSLSKKEGVKDQGTPQQDQPTFSEASQNQKSAVTNSSTPSTTLNVNAEQAPKAETQQKLTLGFFQQMNITTYFGGNQNEQKAQATPSESGKTSNSSLNEEEKHLEKANSSHGSSGSGHNQNQGTGSDGLALVKPNENLTISQNLKSYLFYLIWLSEPSHSSFQFSFTELLRKVYLPDCLRSIVWKKILNLGSNIPVIYGLLQDFEGGFTLFSSEKYKDLAQIEADIPRCHQYDAFCNSYYGKKKLYRTLISYVNSNPSHYYIQGLDSMCFVLLDVFNGDEAYACCALTEIVNKHLRKNKEMTPQDYVLNEKILLYKWLLMLEDPNLSLHLDKTGFGPELYAVTWFMNLFSMVYQVTKVKRIWNYILGNPDFIICFAVSIMMEIKDQLCLKDQSDLMSSIRNLEGVINIDNCISYAEYLSRVIPKNWMILNYLQSESEAQEFKKNQYYITHSWEVPPRYERLRLRKVFFASILDLLDNKNVLYLDLRSSQEFQECSVQGSLYVHNNDGKIPESVMDFLDKRIDNFVSLETFDQSANAADRASPDIYSNKTPFSKNGNGNFNPNNEIIQEFHCFALVWSLDNPQAIEQGLDTLIDQGIQRLVVINGGIQSIEQDAKEILVKKKSSITPLTYYNKRKN